MAKKVYQAWMLFVLIGSAYVAWNWGRGLGFRYACDVIGHFVQCTNLAKGLTGMVVVFALVYWAGSYLATIFRRDMVGSTASFNRRFIGYIYILAIYAISFTAYFLVADLLIEFVRPRSDGALRLLALLFPCGLIYLVLPNNRIHARLKVKIARFLNRYRSIWGKGVGSGGSSRFATLLDEWMYPWQGHGILVGRSIYDPSWLVGINDDRHTITVAGSRIGKGRAVIIPTLLTWKHSAFIIDPKGTNAIVTGAWRGNGGGRVKKGMGQKVYCVNPFGINEGVEGMPPAVRFNPLSVIDPNAQSVYEDVLMIVASLVVRSGSKNDQTDFFDNMARDILAGLIAHAVSTHGKNATLAMIYDMVTELGLPDNSLTQEMQNNEGASGMAKAIGNTIAGMDAKLKSNVLITTGQHISWVSGPAMRRALEATDFDFADLRKEPTTIYLVIPPNELENHGRYLRLFTNVALRAAVGRGKSPTPILLLLDEFYSLGTMTALSSASSWIAGYNIKLWPIVQNLAQLQELYPQNWTTFFANTGHSQFFGINDPITAGFVSEQIGRVVIFETDQQGQERRVGAVDLRDKTEIQKETGRANKTKMIFFRAGDDPMVLYLQNYDAMFKKHQYNHDPDVT